METALQVCTEFPTISPMKLTLHPITLQLKETFTISRGSYSERQALIVELNDGTHSGFGEASEHSYYGVTQKALIEEAEKLRPLIEGYEMGTPEELWEKLATHLVHHPFLQSAIDCAAHDLYGKMMGQPCHKLWGLSTDNLPKTSYTFSIGPIDRLLKKLDTTSFDIYKIKLGTPDDMEVMRALRKHSDATFFIDANCGWTVEETIQNSHTMKALGIDFIEQPLRADDWKGMQKVRAESVLPIIADEACRREEDVEKCAPYFNGISIKLMKCGGLTPALRMARQARSLGLRVMCGCMVESSVGISAIGQLLPLLDQVDMDGSLLLANDPASGVEILPDGSVVLPEGNGLGIRFG